MTVFLIEPKAKDFLQEDTLQEIVRNLCEGYEYDSKSPMSQTEIVPEFTCETETAEDDHLKEFEVRLDESFNRELYGEPKIDTEIEVSEIHSNSDLHKEGKVLLF